LPDTTAECIELRDEWKRLSENKSVAFAIRIVCYNIHNVT
jgi:hypothetical protein